MASARPPTGRILSTFVGRVLEAMSPEQCAALCCTDRGCVCWDRMRPPAEFCLRKEAANAITRVLLDRVHEAKRGLTSVLSRKGFFCLICRAPIGLDNLVPCPFCHGAFFCSKVCLGKVHANNHPHCTPFVDAIHRANALPFLGIPSFDPLMVVFADKPPVPPQKHLTEEQLLFDLF